MSKHPRKHVELKEITKYMRQFLHINNPTHGIKCDKIFSNNLVCHVNGKICFTTKKCQHDVFRLWN